MLSRTEIDPKSLRMMCAIDGMMPLSAHASSQQRGASMAPSAWKRTMRTKRPTRCIIARTGCLAKLQPRHWAALAPLVSRRQLKKKQHTSALCDLTSRLSAPRSAAETPSWNGVLTYHMWLHACRPSSPRQRNAVDRIDVGHQITLTVVASSKSNPVGHEVFGSLPFSPTSQAGKDLSLRKAAVPSPEVLSGKLLTCEGTYVRDQRSTLGDKNPGP